MTPELLQRTALAAGATQLGEAGTLHFILNVEQLARFARAVREVREEAGEVCPPCPPLPY